VEIDSTDSESEKLEKRISTQASLEASFKGGQGCHTIEEKTVT
jgi:hypothetical protein